MKKSELDVGNSWLISRFQQKEIFQNFRASYNSLSSNHLFNLEIMPYLDHEALKLGFTLTLLGSKIVHSKVERGFFSHNLENIVSERTFPESLQDVARINLGMPILYQLALIFAYESLMGWQPENVTRIARAASIEIARITHHFHTLKNTFLSMEKNSLYHLSNQGEMLIRKLFTPWLAINASQESSLNDTLGQNYALEELKLIMAELKESFFSDNEIFDSLARAAKIHASLAGSLGLTGLFLRANRCIYDLRLSPNNSIEYKKVPKLCIQEGGDAYARTELRLKEIEASFNWLVDIASICRNEKLKIMPPTEARFADLSQAKKFYAFGELEGPEGEIKASLVAKDNKLIFKLRSPAYFIAQAIPYMLKNTDIKNLTTILCTLGITAQEVDK